MTTAWLRWLTALLSWRTRGDPCSNNVHSGVNSDFIHGARARYFVDVCALAHSIFTNEQPKISTPCGKGKSVDVHGIGHAT